MKFLYCSLLVLCAVWPSKVFAQGEILKQLLTPTGTIAYVRLDTKSAPKSIGQSREVLRKILSLKPTDELRLQRSEQDKLGYTQQWYKQYYQGIPVEYGLYIVQAKDETIETLNGEFKKISGLSAIPALTEKAALAKALAKIGAASYRWQVPTDEQWIKTLKQDVAATFYPKAELLISEDDAIPAQSRLAFKFAIYAVEPASADYVYVDAASGEVFRKVPIMQPCFSSREVTVRNTANTKGVKSYTPVRVQKVAALAPADLRYTTPSYPRTVTTSQLANGQWQLSETGRRAANSCTSTALTALTTYNMRQQASPGAAVAFTDADNNWTSTEFHNASYDDAALDAHWGAEMTIDYFSSMHCRSSYDGNGAAIRGYVHTNLPAYSSQFSSNDNAAWDPNNSIMVYGDGSFAFQPVTCLDVVAHELGHGFANSMVGNGSGFSTNASAVDAQAINEGLSDIWGACVEHFAAPEKQTWRIAEDITNISSCLRNLANPNVGTASHFPDVYNGQYYDTQKHEPHTNSTVLSHWFYLVAQGGNGTNSSGTPYCVGGIGIDRAAQIVFRAERSKISPTALYATVRQNMIDAASELYGNSSLETAAVINAWYAVGVGAAASTPTITGPEMVCSPTTFAINATNAVWTADPANLFTVTSGSGAQFVTAAVAGAQGSGRLTASVCGLTLVKYVTVGQGDATGTYSNNPYYSMGNPMQSVQFVPANTQYTIMLNQPYDFAFTSNTNGSPAVSVTKLGPQTATFYFPGSSVQIIATSTNAPCPVTGSFVFVAPYSYAAWPNPTTSELTVSAVEHQSSTIQAQLRESNSGAIFNADLYDSFGHRVRTERSSQGQVVFDVRALPTGLYNLRVGSGKDAYTEHIQIEH